jgi:hypothetical protein
MLRLIAYATGCGVVHHDRDANAAENLAWYGRIVVRLLKGEDALSGLSETEHDWFVGPARAKVTPGEIRVLGDGGGGEQQGGPNPAKSYGPGRGTGNAESARGVA